MLHVVDGDDIIVREADVLRFPSWCCCCGNFRFDACLHPNVYGRFPLDVCFYVFVVSGIWKFRFGRLTPPPPPHQHTHNPPWAVFLHVKLREIIIGNVNQGKMTWTLRGS